MKSDKNLIFTDIVYFGLIYPSEKKRENSNRAKSCPPRFVKGFCILYLLTPEVLESFTLSKTNFEPADHLRLAYLHGCFKLLM